jgi:UV excision repair protein RAD23
MMLGADYEQAISNLMEMGFPREQVVKAMKAAYNNPERATEYLLTVLSVLPYTLEHP